MGLRVPVQLRLFDVLPYRADGEAGRWAPQWPLDDE